MPYPNEHACRLRPPTGGPTRRKNGDREHKGKKYDVIYQKKDEGDSWEEQAYRYPKDTWTAGDARDHCEDHDGKFEAAAEKEEGRYEAPDLSAGGQLAHLVRAMAQPLCIERGVLEGFVGVFRQKLLQGVSFDGAALHAEMNIPIQAARGQQRRKARVGIIPVIGVLANRGASLGVSVQRLTRQIEEAVADPGLDALVLDVDSPGGEVTGVPELADRMNALRDEKPIVAVANGLMASGAYWLGSQAREIFVSPSGETGSIGVYMLHEDWSQHLDQEGIRVSAISAGKYKLEGAPWTELSAEAQTFYQGRVQETYDWFVRAVARGRNTTLKAVREGYGEGRVLGAEQSLEAGLADRVGTLDEAIVRAAALAEREFKSRKPSALQRKREIEILRDRGKDEADFRRDRESTRPAA